jgi:predicted ATPase
MPLQRGNHPLYRADSLGSNKFDETFMSWFLDQPIEVTKSGRSVRVFRCRVMRDQTPAGIVQFAVSDQTLEFSQLIDLPVDELGDRLVSILLRHVGWLIVTHRFPRTDNEVFEIRLTKADGLSDSRLAESLAEPLHFPLPIEVPSFGPDLSASESLPLRALGIRSLFGFGPEQRLNLSNGLTVVVGENGSGKSSLRKAFAELSRIANGSKPFSSTPRWKNRSPQQTDLSTRIELLAGLLTYEIELSPGSVPGRAEFDSETLRAVGNGEQNERVFLQRPGKKFDCEFTQQLADPGNSRPQNLESQIAGPADANRAVLADLASLALYPEAASMRRLLSNIKTYSAWDYVDGARVESASVDVRHSSLFHDGSNLTSILHHLEHGGSATFDKWFQEVMRGEPQLAATGAALTYTHWGNEFSVTELSDGSLRWAQTIAALLGDASMVVLDEPELGLHPDLIISLARLLKQSSLRLPIVVFTHSKDLLSQLDSLFRDDQETLNVQVLEQELSGNVISTPNLQALHQEYPHDTLGELWARGLIGGNRW